MLSQEEAKARSSIISDVYYDVLLTLPKGKLYYGDVQISFYVKSIPGEDTFLDYVGTSLHDYSINNVS